MNLNYYPLLIALGLVVSSVAVLSRSSCALPRACHGPSTEPVTRFVTKPRRRVVASGGSGETATVQDG